MDSLSLKALTVIGTTAGSTMLGIAVFAIRGRFCVLEEVDLDPLIEIEGALEDCSRPSVVGVPAEEAAGIVASPERAEVEVEAVAPLSPRARDEIDALEAV